MRVALRALPQGAVTRWAGGPQRLGATGPDRAIERVPWATARWAMPVSPLITARRRPRERTAVRTRQAAVGHVRVRQTGALGEPGHQVALGRAAGDHDPQATVAQSGRDGSVPLDGPAARG
ncbi:hypothetical protein GCM10023097_23290 [Streptomyces collinus]